MKAARIHHFGGPEVIKVDDVPKPEAGDKEILVEIAASSINHIDLSLRAGEMKWLTKLTLPKTLGFDFAGTVVEVGDQVSGFSPGDRVVAMPGLGGGGAGEFATVNQGDAALLPEDVEWKNAAALPLAGATALQCLREYGRLRPGQSVLINGASGGVGSFAVQLAKYFGAEVTAVCREQHFEHVRRLGADHLVDYTQTDLAEEERRFDLVFDAAAKLEPEDLEALARHGGHAVSTRPQPKQFKTALLGRLTGSVKLHFMFTRPRPNDFALLIRLCREGRLKPCVARTFPLAELAEAHHYFENESIEGKIVVTNQPDRML